MLKTPVLQEEETFKGGDFTTGLQSECTPFLIRSLLTVIMSALDVTWTWLAYDYVRSLRLDDWFSERTRHENDAMLWNMTQFYEHLPQVFLAFCVIGSIAHAWYITHFGLLIYYTRRKFFETRDGVLFEWPYLERYNGEVCILLLLLCHNLPIASLLLALQAMVSCEFIIVTQVPVVYACVVTTAISIVYKLGQVIWNWGCCHKNTNYARSRCHSILRTVTLVILFTALTVTSLNLALLKPAASVYKHLPRNKHHSPHPLFDKIYIDDWLRKDQLVLYSHLDTTSSGDDDTFINNPSNQYANERQAITDIMNIHELVRDHNKPVTISKPCKMNRVDMSMYLPNDVREMYQTHANSCRAIFRLYFDLHNQTLYVNYLYKIMSHDRRHCFSDQFMERIAMDDQHRTGAIQDQQRSSPQSDENSDEHSDERSDESSNYPPPSSTAQPAPLRMMMMHEMCFKSDVTKRPNVDVPCGIVVKQQVHPEFADPCAGSTSES